MSNIQKNYSFAYSFDAYVCSLYDCSFEEVLKFLERLGFAFQSVNPKFGYGEAYLFRDGLDNVVLVQFGGVQEHLYLSCMGNFSNKLYEFTRAYEGRLNRADIKLDIDDKNAFDTLVLPFLEIAEQKNLKISQVGDWSLGRGGRTLYVGSRQSAYMVRLYEKYKQSNLYEERASGLIRLELEVKPDKPKEKELGFLMSASELLFSSKTYAPIFTALTDQFYNSISLTAPRKLTNLERTVKHLNKQYNNTFEALLEYHGGDIQKFFDSLFSGEL